VGWCEVSESADPSPIGKLWRDYQRMYAAAYRFAPLLGGKFLDSPESFAQTHIAGLAMCNFMSVFFSSTLWTGSARSELS